jgi:hypothetical protein
VPFYSRTSISGKWILLGFDRTLDGSSNNFDGGMIDGGMIDGGIDHGKSGFFPGVDDRSSDDHHWD